MSIPSNLTIIASHRPGFVTDSAKTNVQKGSLELVALFNQYMVRDLSDLLAAEKIKIDGDKEAAPTKIKIQANQIIVLCSAFPFSSCTHEMRVTVSLADRTLDKVVWSGDFSVGAPFPTNNDESVIQNFSRSIIQQLKDAHLL